jgi:saccharopine dehydrogenase (NADP+, L-glutamate forming)
MTDDTYTIENADSLTYRDFLNSFLPYRPHDTVELKLAHYLGLDINSPEMQKIKWYSRLQSRAHNTGRSD